MTKIVTEKDLRLALGTALRTVNKEIRVDTQHERIVLNKICLKFTKEVLIQLGMAV